jgi:hypothetical protein
VLRIGAGFDHTYAIVGGGALYAWGDNNNSQLARPAGQPALSATALLTMVPLDSAQPMRSVATVTIASPSDGAIVRGTIAIAARAIVPRSNATASCTPAIGDFDTTAVPNGPLTITCGVEDGSGTATRSVSVTVRKDADNDGVPDDLDYCPGTVGPQVVLGCSVQQILACKPGQNGGEVKRGLSPGTLEIFGSLASGAPVGWAAQCSTMYPKPGSD